MPRIAFFPDSFQEVNGVAHTARNFVAFAERHGIPMLCVHAGQSAPSSGTTGSVQRLGLDRGHWAVRMEQDLSFDPFFFRHTQAIAAALRNFRPEVIHITGPSELGILGAWFAWRMGVPLVASWHTNVHEYAGRRLANSLRRLGNTGGYLGHAAERTTLAATARFYRLAEVIYAPNPQLCACLQAEVGRPCHLMQRGVETDLFSPARRTRPVAAVDDSLPTQPKSPVLGYVGRLSVEKNVASLPVIDRALRARGLDPRWVIVGHGGEERQLRRDLGSAAEFTGVLRGEALATAYANMDLLVFPSHTDTFGNVVLEALASGVPAIVTPDGGPASIVRDGETGWVVPDDEFPSAIAALAEDPQKFTAMRVEARSYALGCSWDTVFERVLAAYPV